MQTLVTESQGYGWQESSLLGMPKNLRMIWGLEEEKNSSKCVAIAGEIWYKEVFLAWFQYSHVEAIPS